MYRQPSEIILKDGRTLAQVLDLHGRWLRGREGGEKANLFGADLSRADLSKADLAKADLSVARLSRANLNRADLSGAGLSCACLFGADLSRADLSKADLAKADLSWACLSRANLSCAYLSEADLTEADLTEADLSCAYLTWAILFKANLFRANLTEADLSRAALSDATLPDGWTPLQNSPEDSFVAWKKLAGGFLAKLRIPADARRVNSTERKCRAEFADVLAIFSPDGSEVDGPIFDKHTGKLAYVKGARVFPDAFSADVRTTCAPGIHYFVTRKEAEEY